MLTVKEPCLGGGATGNYAGPSERYSFHVVIENVEEDIDIVVEADMSWDIDTVDRVKADLTYQRALKLANKICELLNKGG